MYKDLQKFFWQIITSIFLMLFGIFIYDANKQCCPIGQKVGIVISAIGIILLIYFDYKLYKENKMQKLRR